MGRRDTGSPWKGEIKEISWVDWEQVEKGSGTIRLGHMGHVLKETTGQEGHFRVKYKPSRESPRDSKKHKTETKQTKLMLLKELNHEKL